MKKRILIVDDEPDFTSLLKYTLESEGYYEVMEENDSTQAVRTAREFGPDVAVLDIMMPELDGSELASRFQADILLRDVPVIFMTALIRREEAPAGSCNSGGQTFLPKDVAIDRLIECIKDKTAPVYAGAAR